MFFARSRRTDVLPIGLHVGADRLRLVQLSAGLALVARYEAPISTTGPGAPSRAAAVAATLRQALRAGRFIGRRVVTAMPPEAVHLRTFRLAPPAAGEEGAWASVARREAAAAAPFGAAEQAHVEAILVGDVRQGGELRREFLAVAARHADVRAYLAQIGGGVEVASLEPEPFAAYRSVATSLGAEVAATLAAVQIGEAESMVLVGSNSRLRVARRVGVGAASFDLAVARKLGVGVPDARRLRRRAAPAPPRSDLVGSAVADALRGPVQELARETILCIRYHAATFRAPMPAAIRLLGTEARDPLLVALVEAASGLPADVRGALDGIAFDPAMRREATSNVTDGAGADDGGWGVAFGLGLKFAPAAQDSRQLAGDVSFPLAAPTPMNSARSAVGA